MELDVFKNHSTKNCELNIQQRSEMESKSIYFYSGRQKAKVPTKTNKQIGKITKRGLLVHLQNPD